MQLRPWSPESDFCRECPFCLNSDQVRGDDKAKVDKKDQPDDEVGATEDLMREHGVLNRILLIYKEGLRRLRDKEEITPDVFHKPATLVRKFVEDYHEKLEEKFIFPEFEKAKKLVDLVKVLREQHEAGRKVTDVILRNAVADQFRKEDARKELVRSCEAFIRMYRPHEAREDTVLFPALHKIVPAKQLQGTWRAVREGGGPSVRGGRVREDGRAGCRHREAVGHLGPRPIHGEVMLSRHSIVARSC